MHNPVFEKFDCLAGKLKTGFRYMRQGNVIFCDRNDKKKSISTTLKSADRVLPWRLLAV